MVAAQPGDTPARSSPPVKVTHSPRWSPDGRRLVYVRGGAYFALEKINLATRDQRNPRRHDRERRRPGADRRCDLGCQPGVGPRMARVLFVSNRSGAREVYLGRLIAIGGPPGARGRVTSGLNAHSILVEGRNRWPIHPSRFAPKSGRSRFPDQRIAVTADARQVTFGSEKTEKLAVSRDGVWLAFDSDRSGTPMSGSSGSVDRAQPVTRDPANEFANDWSPDGKEIPVPHDSRRNQRDVMSVTADGTAGDRRRHDAHRGAARIVEPGRQQHRLFWRRSNRDLYNVFVTTRARQDAPWGAPRQLTT